MCIIRQPLNNIYTNTLIQLKVSCNFNNSAIHIGDLNFFKYPFFYKFPLIHKKRNYSYANKVVTCDNGGILHIIINWIQILIFSTIKQKKNPILSFNSLFVFLNRELNIRIQKSSPLKHNLKKKFDVFSLKHVWYS